MMNSFKVFVILLFTPAALFANAARFLSHPPLRPLPEATNRPLPAGPLKFVDPAKGSDEHEGSETRPWATLGHALSQLAPGDTLVLRGGVYRESVKCSLSGTPDQPITIRSHPGERAVLDGGLAGFYDQPESAWVPAEGGAPGEYRSAGRHRNLAGVAGMFGDSHIGLLTYWRIEDLRSENETWRRDPESGIFKTVLYCGPGLFHDQATGYIHCRLRHTHNNHPAVADYRGETDPRKLPLVIGPVDALPLHLLHARHVRIQDLVVRGGGSRSALLEYCGGVELDGVVFLCGNITGEHSGLVRITNCAVYGRVPPWMWRIDSSNGCASGASRDVVRMINPTLLDTSRQGEGMAIPRLINDALRGDGSGGDMEVPQMIHHPGNHDWDISWSDFSDGHDGVFLRGRNMRFHHNFIEDIQDDATDISAALPAPDDSMELSGNLIRRSLTAFSSHNYNVPWPRGKAYIARNIR